MQNKSPSIKVAVDAIVFGYAKNDGVSVLLIQRKYEPFKNNWAIPGGLQKKINPKTEPNTERPIFVKKNIEDSAAAKRSKKNATPALL